MRSARSRNIFRIRSVALIHENARNFQKETFRARKVPYLVEGSHSPANGFWRGREKGVIFLFESWAGQNFTAYDRSKKFMIAQEIL